MATLKSCSRLQMLYRHARPISNKSDGGLLAPFPSIPRALPVAGILSGLLGIQGPLTPAAYAQGPKTPKTVTYPDLAFARTSVPSAAFI